MYPTLWQHEAIDLFGISLGPFVLQSYGLMIALGFLATTALGCWAGRRLGLKLEDLLDLSFWALIGGILGGRLLFAVIEIPSYYQALVSPELPNSLTDGAPIGNVAFWDLLFLRGGMVWLGGVAGCFAAAYFFAKKRGLSFWLLADAGVFGAPIGHFFGRLGCWLAGCCYGNLGQGPTCARYPALALPYHPSADYPAQNGHLASLHAAPLYEAAGELLLFGLLFWSLRKRRFAGQLSLTFLAAYSVLRFVVEFFRGDSVRGFFVSHVTRITQNGATYDEIGGLSTSQGMSLLILLAVLLAWPRLARAKTAADPKSRK